MSRILAGNCKGWPDKVGDWQIGVMGHAGGARGPLLIFACPLGQPHACTAALNESPPHPNGAHWTWDGDRKKPTLSPSINCNGKGACGFHKTLVQGEWK